MVDDNEVSDHYLEKSDLQDQFTATVNKVLKKRDETNPSLAVS
jgi:hypothetical protein